MTVNESDKPHVVSNIFAPKNVGDSVTHISVLVASPSDVRDERDALERVVKELNLTVAPTGNARLELVRWETHAHPAIASDPQQAINIQIGGPHDVVIGLFWGRIGTPTPRSGSGTLEELEAAISRWEADKDSVEVMIYFKEDGIPPSQADPEQLRRLASFRESLPKRGVLYRQVAGKEFESLLRIDLARTVMNRLAQKSAVHAQSSTTSPPSTSISIPINMVIDQDEGIEDLLFQSTADLEQSAAIMGRINVLVEESTVGITRHNPDLEGPNRRVALDGVASELQSFSEKLTQETGLLGFHQERAFGALARSIVMAAEDGALGQNEIAILLPKVVETAGTLKAFAAALHEARATLSTMPRMTRALNIAKRNATGAIDLLLSKLEAVARVQDSIHETLTRNSSS